ncbi:MAG: DUF3368 domain-containing protein [Coleofasciculus sp. D1-CHI-01]|uniref:DUF3368 domain-containing protein n=1 Tax=Coleofasciculus sp. D1-CHI-01 TaxID=3068482 RepID=UPI0032FC06B1
MIIISDTSPITNLAAVGHLSLLQQLYGDIIIPERVYQELTGAGDSIPGCREVQTLAWISVRSAVNQEQVRLLQDKLDAGEAEAITLAVELDADWLLIDEELGRTIAAEYQIQFTGVLGILIEAKYRGLITQVKPLLDELIRTADFWVSDRLYSRVLQMAGEAG